MAVQIARTNFHRLTADELAAWKKVPAAIASDAQNRSMSLSGEIKALKSGWKICGQARTVEPTPGDNACVHVLCSTMQPGDVIVVAAAGREDVAMAGEMVTRQCMIRKGAGIVVDGAVRDCEVLLGLNMPVFCRSVTPRGPVKEFGGFIDIPVGIGCMSISPGDIILGDDDGVAVVPLVRAAAVLLRCQEQMRTEQSWVKSMEAGKTIAELFNVRQPEYID